MKKEKLPDPSKLKWRRGLPFKFSPEDLHPSNVKVRITTYISEDIYRWLKAEADRTGAPYQILLNQKLRHVFDEEDPNALARRVKHLEEQIRKLKAA